VPEVKIKRTLPFEDSFQAWDEYKTEIDGVQVNGIIRDVVPLEKRVEIALELSDDDYARLPGYG
jgi:hypothetical protein